MDKGKILSNIEDLRQQMHALAQEKGLTHPDVLEVSESIDVEMNTYIKLANMSKRKSKKSAPDPALNQIYLGYIIGALKRRKWTVDKIAQVVDAVALEYDLRALEDAERVYKRFKI